MNYRKASDLFLDAMKAVVNPPQGVALPWWPKFTSMIGGLRPHELTLLCAPTGAGKTTLLAQLSAQLCLQSVPHFVAPVETGDEDFVVRVTSALAGRDLNSGDPVHPEALRRVTEMAAGVMAKAPLFVATHDNRVSVKQMIAELTYMHQRHGAKVALLDNLNFFLEVVSQQMERAEMDNAIHEFVMLAKRLPLHVILIVHPRKTEAGRVENEFDIKGSSTAVQESANVVLFNRPKQEDVERGNRDLSDRELVFRKIRKRGFNVGRPIWFNYREARFQEES